MAEDTVRTADCQCGALRLETRGEPVLVPICGCSHCRKRTGAAFGTGVYFNADQVTVTSGAATVYRRGSDAGRWFDNHFCPTCGTTVYWKMEFWPERIGVAFGCFDDPEGLPKPSVAVFAEHIADWAGFDDAIAAYPGARPAPPKAPKNG